MRALQCHDLDRHPTATVRGNATERDCTRQCHRTRCKKMFGARSANEPLRLSVQVCQVLARSNRSNKSRSGRRHGLVPSLVQTKHPKRGRPGLPGERFKGTCMARVYFLLRASDPSAELDLLRLPRSALCLSNLLGRLPPGICSRTALTRPSLCLNPINYFMV